MSVCSSSVTPPPVVVAPYAILFANDILSGLFAAGSLRQPRDGLFAQPFVIVVCLLLLLSFACSLLMVPANDQIADGRRYCSVSLSNIVIATVVIVIIVVMPLRKY
jgi:hypothetical protein